MEQTVVAVPDKAGHFEFTKHLPHPLKVIALWISSDGDDTHSSFSVTIKHLQLVAAKE